MSGVIFGGLVVIPFESAIMYIMYCLAVVLSIVKHKIHNKDFIVFFPYRQSLLNLADHIHHSDLGRLITTTDGCKQK
jgi:hypothetical protein